MNAEEARAITESTTVNEKKLKWLYRRIARAAKAGETNIEFHAILLSNPQMDFLKSQGYSFGPMFGRYNGNMRRIFWDDDSAKSVEPPKGV